MPPFLLAEPVIRREPPAAACFASLHLHVQHIIKCRPVTPVRLTGEEVSDLFDEVSQVIVGALHFVLGGRGFVQSCLGFTFRLLGLRLGICHLNERRKCS